MWAKNSILIAVSVLSWNRWADATTYVYQPTIDLTEAQNELLHVVETQRRGPGSVPFAILVDNVRSWQPPSAQPSGTLQIASAREPWAVEPEASNIGRYCASQTAQLLAIEPLGAAYPEVFRWTLRFWSQPVPSGTRLSLTTPPLHEDDAIFIAYVVNGSPRSFKPGDLHHLFGRLTYPETLEHPVTTRRIITPAIIAQRPMTGLIPNAKRSWREFFGPAQVCKALSSIGLFAVLTVGSIGVFQWIRLRTIRAKRPRASSRVEGTPNHKRLPVSLVVRLRTFRILPCMVFLSLGVATTIAMAWWIAVNPPFVTLQGTYKGYYIDDDQVLWFLESRQAEGKRFTRLRPALRWQERRLQQRPTRAFFEEFEKLPLPPKPRFVTARGIDDLRERIEGLDIGDLTLWHDIRRGPDAVWRSDKEFGCPMLALRHYSISELNEQTGNWFGYEGGTLVVDSTPGQRKVVPLIPVLPGFAVNSVFYAMLWFMPFCVVTAARRARRRHKGHCPRCNYDLCHSLESGCTECGWMKTDTIHLNT